MTSATVIGLKGLEAGPSTNGREPARPGWEGTTSPQHVHLNCHMKIPFKYCGAILALLDAGDAAAGPPQDGSQLLELLSTFSYVYPIVKEIIANKPELAPMINGGMGAPQFKNNKYIDSWFSVLSKTTASDPWESEDDDAILRFTAKTDPKVNFDGIKVKASAFERPIIFEDVLRGRCPSGYQSADILYFFIKGKLSEMQWSSLFNEHDSFEFCDKLYHIPANCRISRGGHIEMILAISETLFANRNERLKAVAKAKQDFETWEQGQAANAASERHPKPIKKQNPVLDESGHEQHWRLKIDQNSRLRHHWRLRPQRASTISGNETGKGSSEYSKRQRIWSH